MICQSAQNGMQGCSGLEAMLNDLFSSPEVTVVAEGPHELVEDLRRSIPTITSFLKAPMLLDLQALWCDFWLHAGPSLPRRKLLPWKVTLSDMALAALGKPLDVRMHVRPPTSPDSLLQYAGSSSRLKPSCTCVLNCMLLLYVK
jgi:hypothetical protein